LVPAEAQTTRHTSSYTWSCRFIWCLAEDYRNRDQRRALWASAQGETFTLPTFGNRSNDALLFWMMHCIDET